MLTNDLHREAQRSLQRLLPRVLPELAGSPDRDVFISRLDAHFPRLFGLLHSVYGGHYDFFYHLEAILRHAAQMFAQRPADLKALDAQREAAPQWFQSEQMMGGVCYVDLFAGDLAGIRARLPYFKELGLTYLHLMPLFRAPDGNSDGGYAVSSYREVNPALGTMAELAQLAGEMRAQGISLVLDFVFNHTSDEHEWALKAQQGDPTYQGYYYLFDDRSVPDQYERTLREIFPEHRRGNFTFNQSMRKWVWTTFHSFQWDLNYSNPEVFNAMMGEMLTLANNGVEILRLDAVAFIWKQLGTPCENLPQVHALIQAFNAVTRIVAPAMLFKSEAIVHPRDVESYVSWEECPISYNPTMMALCWEAIATRDVKLLRHSMIRRFQLPADCAWVNYIRSHDDIGWTFADEDAAELWINGYNHRQFLNQFYSGRFPGTFARGLPFNYNPANQDMRISGTCASLAGLETALDAKDDLLIEHAIRRIVLIYSVALSAGGIPLLYLGDEIGTLNDYAYQSVPAKAEDSRWVHRPAHDAARAAARTDATSIPGRIFQPLHRLIWLRKQTPALANTGTTFFDTGNTHVLGYSRSGEILCLANFSERQQAVHRDALAAHWDLTGAHTDLTTGATYILRDLLVLEPYQFVWLRRG
jgi:glycosidase